MPTIEGASQEATAEALEDVASKFRKALASRHLIEAYSQSLAADDWQTIKAFAGLAEVMALESTAEAEPARAMTASENAAESENVWKNLSLVEKLQSAVNPSGHEFESHRRPASRTAARGGEGGSVAEELDALTADEWNEFIRETLKRIGAQGLDDPKAHLEFVRRQLRAAVA
jgi:hypothetical protein